MDNLSETRLTAPKQINRDYLKQMSKDMVRKDFEALRIQDGLLNIFGDAEIFSMHKDELSSIQHCLELASSNLIVDTSEDIFWSIICDSSISLAFDYKRGSLDQIKVIKGNADIIVDLIFKSCEQESENDKQQIFIRGFEVAFPHLNIPFIKKRKMELNNGLSGLNH